MSFSKDFLEKEAVRINGTAFLEKVKLISELLKINHGWLLSVMYFESARSFRADVQAPGNSNYVGLIQFGHAAAKDLGTTVAQLKLMSAIDQLDYVHKFYQMWIDRFTRIMGRPFYYKDALDLYTATLYPAALGKSDDYILGSADNTVASVAYGNRWFDLNKDGKITNGEFRSYIRTNIFAEYENDVLGTSAINKKGFFLDFSQYLRFYSVLPTIIKNEVDNLLNYLLKKGYIEKLA